MLKFNSEFNSESALRSLEDGIHHVVVRVSKNNFYVRAAGFDLSDMVTISDSLNEQNTAEGEKIISRVIFKTNRKLFFVNNIDTPIKNLAEEF